MVRGRDIVRTKFRSPAGRLTGLVAFVRSQAIRSEPPIEGEFLEANQVPGPRPSFRDRREKASTTL